MILILLAINKAHSQDGTMPFLSIQPNEGVDLGRVSVTVLHSHADLVLIGLDIHKEHKCVAFFYLHHDRLAGQGELDVIVVKLLS